jgi:hypothetical protein
MSTTYKTLESALDIIDQDIAKIQKLSKEEKTLDRSEANKLTDYIKALLSVHKEEREEIKSLSLQSKGTDDLEELAKQALDTLGLLPEEEQEEEQEEAEETKEEAEAQEKDDEATDKLQTDEPKG